MAVWELIVEGVSREHARGQQWLTNGEIIRAAEAVAPGTNPGSVSADAKFHCINDPSKKHSPGLQYLRNPLLVTDDPTMHGKRYRLLTEAERNAFLQHLRDDLEQYSYVQVVDWLQNPTTLLAAADEATDELDDDTISGDLVGPALLELHLQDYLQRNWRSHFPSLEWYEGARGREFATSNPSMGIIDFLAVDRDGNFVVIRDEAEPSRQTGGGADPRLHGMGGGAASHWTQRPGHARRRRCFRRPAHGGLARYPTWKSGSMSCRFI